MKKPILFLLTLICSLSVMASSSQPRHVTIMGLGDSITEGSDHFYSYVFPLWELLFSHGYTNCEFIGPRQGRCRLGTIPHCGFSGKNVEFLNAHIDSIYRLYPADIVLLHAGHNHFDTEHPVPGMIASYRSIIAKIHAINPKAVIIMAKVITSGKLPKYSYIPLLNEEIEKLVKSYHSDRIRLVDQSAGWDWQRYTIYDKVHPKLEGARKMARVWYNELVKILPRELYVNHVDTVVYKSGQGQRDLTLTVYSPRVERKPVPAVVYFFAGGWQYGSPLQFVRECYHDTKLGYKAISVDYRIASLDKTTPADSYVDVADAYQWIVRHADSLNIDPTRIVLAGASAGATMAAAAGMDSRLPMPAGLMLYYPVVKKIAAFVPENNRRTMPPFLFLIGDKDSFTTLADAENFLKAQQSKGVDVTSKVFSGAGHPLFYYRLKPTALFGQYLSASDNFLRIAIP